MKKFSIEIYLGFIGLLLACSPFFEEFKNIKVNIYYTISLQHIYIIFLLMLFLSFYLYILSNYTEYFSQKTEKIIKRLNLYFNSIIPIIPIILIINVLGIKFWMYGSPEKFNPNTLNTLIFSTVFLYFMVALSKIKRNNELLDKIEKLYIDGNEEITCAQYYLKDDKYVEAANNLINSYIKLLKIKVLQNKMISPQNGFTELKSELIQLKKFSAPEQLIHSYLEDIRDEIFRTETLEFLKKDKDFRRLKKRLDITIPSIQNEFKLLENTMDSVYPKTSLLFMK